MNKTKGEENIEDVQRHGPHKSFPRWGVEAPHFGQTDGFRDTYFRLGGGLRDVMVMIALEVVNS